MSDQVDEAATPNFADLYRTSEYVTPRMACRLWNAALICADTWRLAAGDVNILLEELPPIARPHATGPWLDRFIAGFDALADRIAAGDVAEEVLTTCTGEEMAVHILIDFAEGHSNSGLDTHDNQLQQLPERGATDSDFELMRDILLRDNDVLMLFDPSLDGIDDPDNALTAAYRTVNLHPNRWFLPFDDTWT